MPDNNNVSYVGLQDLENAWRSIKARALQERDWVTRSRLGQAASNVEQLIGQALVDSGAVSGNANEVAQAAGQVLESGGSVAAAVNDNAAHAADLAQQGIAAAAGAANLGTNILVGGAAGWGVGALLGSKSPLAVGALGALAGAIFRPIR